MHPAQPISLAAVLRSKCGDRRNLDDLWSRPSASLVTFLNPASYMSLRCHPEVFQEIDLFMADGLSMAITLSLVMSRTIERTSFDMTSLAPLVFDRCASEDRHLAVIGAKRDEIDRFVETITVAYPMIDIVYSRHGYFDSEIESEECVRDAVASGASVFLLGLGCPLQERLGALAKRHCGDRNAVIFTCGGFIHQTAGCLEYYPEWVDALHLRWAYRLLFEPHTRVRFLGTYPRFPVTFFRDLRAGNRNSSG